MKVEITKAEKKSSLVLPTRLIFSKAVLKLVLKNRRMASKLEKIPPEALDAMIEELNRVKKNGSWVLVSMDSANGEQVKITI